MTYEHSRLDGPALRALAVSTASRIFPAQRTSWWRSVLSAAPDPRQGRFRHLCERFTSGEYTKEPFLKVKEGDSLRLREDGVIEFARYTLQQDRIPSYNEVRPATDQDLLLPDHVWEEKWSDGRERVLNASHGRLTVVRKGDGLRRLLENLR
ncbi:hypothetical protein OHA72_48955 [Dactylosporangium sp. NBC_01737]|uniref:hypothetical protein n=1 Tax=Dactylosporangium sp. NBC_01737 TaxID=2975959 RepID=UPI002E104968|nr:hypothetical protein OHA72_48955 [Dactylosporangium sp. NBC_01737]